MAGPLAPHPHPKRCMKGDGRTFKELFDRHVSVQGATRGCLSSRLQAAARASSEPLKPAPGASTPRASRDLTPEGATISLKIPTVALVPVASLTSFINGIFLQIQLQKRDVR